MEVVCYNCVSKEHVFYYEENSFTLVKCVSCGLLFVNNRPGDTEISQAHKQGKHKGLQALEVTGEFDTNRRYDLVLNDLYKDGFGNIKTWLDVGCGHGEFIEAVTEYGDGKLNVVGSEPNVHKQDSARKRGLNVNYFDLETHDTKYDVISLLNVYSHLPDPPAFLLMLKNLLNPNGELILQTGDTANLSAKMHYKPFSLPDHLSFVSEDILVSILERIGFEIISIIKYRIVRTDFISIAKEMVKLFLPHYKSKLNLYFMQPTDMYIRARIV